VSYLTNQEPFLKLIRQFLNSNLNGETFCHEFMNLWRNDRDQQYAQRNTWKERFDIQLIEAYSRKQLTDEEFSRKWEELWGYGEYEPLSEMLDKDFTACDCFSSLPENEFEIDEAQLKKEVAENLAYFEAQQTKATS
jgi:hypothetical protein